MTVPRSLSELTSWLDAAPPGTMLPAASVRSLLGHINGPVVIPVQLSDSAASSTPPTWREKLWTCPSETRLGVRELAEAMGRPKSFVYRLTCITAVKAGKSPLPHRKLDGELVFVAREIRTWLASQEEVIASIPNSDSAASVRPISTARRAGGAR